MEANAKNLEIIKKLENVKEFKNIDEETLEILSDIEDSLSEMKTEQIDDNSADRQVEFLTECMEQNLEHARHVEGERMEFIQIHLVLVGGVLAILAESAFEKKSLVVLVILIAITLLGFMIKVLLKRWDQVFVAHRSCAMYCYIRISEICDFKDNMLTEFPMNILSDVKRKIPASFRSSVPYYPFTFSESGKTGRLIRMFTNGLILVTGIVAAGYFITYWLMPAIS